jgi:hypothetical protein
LPLIAAAALVFPAPAAAHGRGAAIALDYRLRLDPAATSIPGVHVRVLDGDRALELRVERGRRVVVRGLLHEPVLRFGSDGVWVNADSPTAAADKLVSRDDSGWLRLSGADSYAWHDHRLAPPPTVAVGPAGQFSIPLTVDGRAAAVHGTFWRVARPAAWPWLVGAGVLAAAIVAAATRRPWRGPLTIGLAVGAGLAALVTVTTFAARDAPNGRVAWVPILAGIAVGAICGALLVRLHGRSRIQIAGLIGVLAAAVCLGSLPVFWHGVVISALPATLVRLACGLALLGGVSAALLSFSPDLEESPKSRRLAVPTTGR